MALMQYNKTLNYVVGLIGLYGKLCNNIIFTMGLSINDSPNPVQFEAIGTSADEMNTSDNCIELFLTIVTRYDYVHSYPL